MRLSKQYLQVARVTADTSVVCGPRKMSDQSGEWDRRKAYLVRCLFEDLPRLSRISERREPDQSADSAEYRHSALPDLIIEKERNRHDEPEEFYQELEARMLSLYRKLFRNEHYDSSSMAIGSDADFDLVEDIPSRQNYDDEKASNKSQDDNLDDDDEAVDDDDDAFEQLIEESILQDVLKSDDESSEGARHEIITTLALVHAEDEDRYRPDVNNNVAEETVAGRSPILTSKYLLEEVQELESGARTPEQLVSTQDVTYAAAPSPILPSRAAPRESVERETRRIEGLVATQGAAQRYSTSTSYEFSLYDFSPVEVMRQKLSEAKSEGSLADLRPRPASVMDCEQMSPLEIEKKAVSDRKSQSLIERKMNSETEKTSIRECDDGHDIVPADQILSPVLNTSHRKRARPADIADTSKEPPRKRIKYKHVEPRPNYFCGTPLIYNLCRCKGHVCQ